MASRKKKKGTAAGQPKEPAAETTDESDAPRAVRRPRSWRRALAFRLIAVSLPFLCLAALNLLFYALDWGHDTRMIVRSAVAPEGSFELNESASYSYFLNRDLAGPEPRPFQMPKPAALTRIVVVGASTVEGFPYPGSLAFARQVERLLQLQYPDRQFEVLNAGIVAINTFAIVDVVGRLAPCQPDLIVVYTGHNEFYGPGGVGSNATFSPRLYPVMTRLRRFRLFQSVVGWLERDDPDKPLISALPREFAIPYDSSVFTAAEGFYRRNLGLIVDAAGETPVLLCSVACNLSSQSPMQSISLAGLTEQDQGRRDALLDSAKRKLAEDQIDAAEQFVAEAEGIDPKFALTVFRRAQCLAARGERARASDAFSLARDLDGCRFRAPSSFREIAAAVASEKECLFLDLNRGLADASERAAPGDDFFMEHVHYNFDGHRQVAVRLAQAIAEQLLNRPWDPAAVPQDDDYPREMGLTALDQLTAAALMYGIAHTVPLSDAPDQPEQVNVLDEMMQRYLNELSPAEQQVFAQLPQEQREQGVLNGVAAGLIQLGQFDRALELFEVSKRRRPWLIEAYVGAAKCWLSLGDREQAKANILAAQRIAPNDRDLIQILGGL